jgi:hypothetical protein
MNNKIKQEDIRNMEQGSLFKLRYFIACTKTKGRSQWMSVPCECCVLSGSLCDGLITRPEESYRVWCLASVIE